MLRTEQRTERTSESVLLSRILRFAPEQGQRDRLLHVVVSVDRGRHRGEDALGNARVLGQFADGLQEKK